ncbi:hypothetical protein WA026_016551 [Henosepilachna vigintioctopunctata]|uniref:Uncharacterized protein n=1 Tax=Henosepilachna vigintioctopunctata TaxID=420089 RepID=A0AAW1V8U2_9CUCU
MFFREHKKVQSSESGRGTETENVYVPNWVHYNELRFLNNIQRAARAGTNSLGTSAPSASGESTENDWKNSPAGFWYHFSEKLLRYFTVKTVKLLQGVVQQLHYHA